MLTRALVHDTVSVVLFATVSVVDFVRLQNHPIISIARETVIAISITEAISGETPFLMGLLAARLINNFSVFQLCLKSDGHLSMQGGAKLHLHRQNLFCLMSIDLGYQHKTYVDSRLFKQSSIFH